MAFAADEPVFQATNTATDRAPVDPAQPVAIHLGDDLHDAPINRVALTGQLGQLLEQHLKTLVRAHYAVGGEAVEDITSSSQPGTTSDDPISTKVRPLQMPTGAQTEKAPGQLAATTPDPEL